MQPFLIDTHAHIYLPQFDSDREEIIWKAKTAGVTKIYLPAIDASTHQQMLRTEAEFSFCKSMMGLHPCSVNENYTEEIAVVEKHLAGRSFVAVGEIGLDFYWDKTFVQQQYKAFERQIELALAYKLPIVIHSRDATDECIEVVSKYPSLRGVFHCFTGTEVQAQKIVELNFMLGIGGVVTFKNAGLDNVISQLGLSSVILETDAPYLAPAPYRGKRNEPSYVKTVAERLASLLNLSLEEVASTTSSNAEKLFSFGENR